LEERDSGTSRSEVLRAFSGS